MTRLNPAKELENCLGRNEPTKQANCSKECGCCEVMQMQCRNSDAAIK
jgi:hypothetical protein